MTKDPLPTWESWVRLLMFPSPNFRPYLHGGSFLLLAVKTVRWDFTWCCFCTQTIAQLIVILAKYGWIIPQKQSPYSKKQKYKQKHTRPKNKAWSIHRLQKKNTWFLMRDLKPTWTWLWITDEIILNHNELNVNILYVISIDDECPHPAGFYAFLDLGELPIPCSSWLAKLLIMVWTASNFCSLLSILPM